MSSSMVLGLGSQPPPPPGAPPGSPPIPGSVVADQRLVQVLFLAAFVLVLYDHLLTLRAEHRFVWARFGRLRPSAMWFLLNRYFVLLTNVVIAAFTFARVPPELCQTFLTTTKIFLLAQQAVVYYLAILVLRVYAMFNLNRRLLTALCIAGFFVFVAALYLVTTGTEPPPLPPPPPPSFNDTSTLPDQYNGFTLPIPPPQCLQPIFHSSALRIAGAWEGLLLLETLIFVLTLVRGLKHHRGAGPGSALIRSLTWDGSWYFFAIVLVNVANLVMYYVSDPLLAGSLTWLASSLSAVLVGRLMLNLNSVADARPSIYDSDVDHGGFFVVPRRVGRASPAPVLVEVELQQRGPSMSVMGEDSESVRDNIPQDDSWGRGRGYG
ncbi:hypothetical protein C8F01DRAFT_1167616 [Mycena amicta]|nr:hypothetical protein C8F01DRAFT_1167616 [Mycena amicta]